MPQKRPAQKRRLRSQRLAPARMAAPLSTAWDQLFSTSQSQKKAAGLAAAGRYLATCTRCPRQHRGRLPWAMGSMPTPGWNEAINNHTAVLPDGILTGRLARQADPGSSHRLRGSIKHGLPPLTPSDSQTTSWAPCTRIKARGQLKTSACLRIRRMASGSLLTALIASGWPGNPQDYLQIPNRAAQACIGPRTTA